MYSPHTWSCNERTRSLSRDFFHSPDETPDSHDDLLRCFKKKQKKLCDICYSTRINVCTDYSLWTSQTGIICSLFGLGRRIDPSMGVISRGASLGGRIRYFWRIEANPMNNSILANPSPAHILFPIENGITCSITSWKNEDWDFVHTNHWDRYIIYLVRYLTLLGVFPSFIRNLSGLNSSASSNISPLFITLWICAWIRVSLGMKWPST